MTVGRKMVPEKLKRKRQWRLGLEFEAPGLAFWRHKPDRWAYGFLALEIDLNDPSLPGIRPFWFKGADPSPGTPWWALHFDWFDVLRIWLGGPVSIRFLYIIDRKN